MMKKFKQVEPGQISPILKKLKHRDNVRKNNKNIKIVSNDDLGSTIVFSKPKSNARVNKILMVKHKKKINTAVEKKKDMTVIDNLIKDRNNLKKMFKTNNDPIAQQIMSKKIVGLSKRIGNILKKNNSNRISQTTGNKYDNSTFDTNSEANIVGAEPIFPQSSDKKLSAISIESYFDYLLKGGLSPRQLSFRKGTSIKYDKVKSKDISLKEKMRKNQIAKKLEDEFDLMTQVHKIDSRKANTRIKIIPSHQFIREKDKPLFTSSLKINKTLHKHKFNPSGFKSYCQSQAFHSIDDNIDKSLPNLHNHTKTNFKPIKFTSINLKKKHFTVEEENSDTLIEKSKLPSPNHMFTLQSPDKSSEKTRPITQKSKNIKSIENLKKICNDAYKENLKISKQLRTQKQLNKTVEQNVVQEKCLNNLEELYEKVYKDKNKCIHKSYLHGSKSNIRDDEKYTNYMGKSEKRILYQVIQTLKHLDRILKIDEKRDGETAYEKRLNALKEKYNFKELSRQTMFLMYNQGNYNDEVDFMEEMINEVTSIDYLDWQLRKLDILKRV